MFSLIWWTICFIIVLVKFLFIEPSIQQQHSLFSQASWGRLKLKPKRNKGHGSCTLIACLQTLLSKAISLEIFQSLRSISTDSSHVSLGLPLPLFTLSTSSGTPPCTDASWGLRWTCHLNQYWVSFSSIGATPTLSWIVSFWTLSLLVCLQNHHNIRIFATLSCWTTFSTV